MTVGSALRAGIRLLVDRPASVLPVYLLGAGLTATVRVPVLVAIATVVGLLASDGRLETLVTELEGYLRETDFEGNAAASPPEIPPGLESAVTDAFSLPVVGVLAVGVTLSILIGVVANALANAAALHGVYGALTDDDALSAALAGLGRDWGPFVGLSVLKTALVVLGAIPALIGVGLFSVSPAAGGVATAVGVLIGGGIILVGLLALAFAGQSVVVDDAGIGGAIRNSTGFPFRRPGAFVGYLVVAIAVFGALSLLGSLFSLLGVSQLSGLVGPLLLLPFLDIFKLALYADRKLLGVADETDSPADSADSAATTPSQAPQPPHRHRAVAAFRDGLAALAGFLRGHPLPVLLATGLFTLAAVLSFQLTASFGTEIPLPEDVRNVFGTVPLDTFVMLAANNWLVSATAAYGGIALGVPTAVDMLLNGAIVGALYGVTDQLGFVALVAPHGIIEIPAIFVAGGLGFHVAGTVLGRLTGRATTADIADALRLAYRVLLGLAVVLVVAALIEAFLTPWIAAAVLG
ncbi:stage II sporulation protein M [Halonotius terrestris]|uniref:Stage II sporulation protein M n=1 Tax=Halonotius terrestris TaxID=2487750 RepID=A0A8J8PBQ2_9EURY|nr:stage II sporulation protein M [Halonotius terrestris]TQQ83767.1 stage II sporulation protein M [Halonotius terrestris]